MNTEEQSVVAEAQETIMDLEEDVIPNEDDDIENALSDVIPCELVTVDSQSADDGSMGDTLESGLYDDSDYTPPSTDIEKMVDISTMVEVAPQTVSEYELEEAYIPNEDNKPDDDQLDDVA